MQEVVGLCKQELVRSPAPQLHLEYTFYKLLAPAGLYSCIYLPLFIFHSMYMIYKVCVCVYVRWCLWCSN